MNSYILPESFFEPTTIHSTQRWQNNQRWQNTTLNSNKRISGVTVTDFAFVFQPNGSLQYTSHRICPCISNKQIFSVAVIELDFVFYNKTVRDISKNIKNQLTIKNFAAFVSSLYYYF